LFITFEHTAQDLIVLSKNFFPSATVSGIIGQPKSHFHILIENHADDEQCLAELENKIFRCFYLYITSNNLIEDFIRLAPSFSCQGLQASGKAIAYTIEGSPHGKARPNEKPVDPMLTRGDILKMFALKAATTFDFKANAIYVIFHKNEEINQCKFRVAMVGICKFIPRG
jgi:hypothetical protein